MRTLPTCFGNSDPKRPVKYRQPLTRIEDQCRLFSLAQLQKATNNFNQYQKIGAGYTLYKGCINIGGTDSYPVWIKRFSKGDAAMQSDIPNRVLLEERGNRRVDCSRVKSGYLPPEYAINGILIDKCDVYLFGLIMLELVLVCGKKLINALIERRDLNKAEDKDRSNDDCDGEEDWKCYYSEIQDQARLICNNAKGYADKFIDPYIFWKIIPECWKAYMNIATRCLHPEAMERPTMREVQLKLEHALEIQDAAEDANNQGIVA
ncbi:PREDICTED: receptor-like protein kinase ANXUR2 [Lupinus angustifolius]|uniref:receptor-like protein kinase ANXUR2 n=1 Tax=Lupinus angustifolius TaxID=3871 RepID=UPI00092E91E0|nr:PREDICTED: receptor-like protein kinase ANXUR2 [Lupinus angustifolius]